MPVGAAGGTTDLFSGTAAALAHSGIRAVAAMQFSISDIAAVAFARGFYTALAYGRGIDEAVRSGRIGILGIGRGTLEWVTPVLYLRGEDAHLFDVVPTAVGSRRIRTSRLTATPRSARRRGAASRPQRATPRQPRPRRAQTAHRHRSRWRLWLVVGLVAVVAAGGVTAALLALRPDGTGGGSGDGGGPGASSRRAPRSSRCRCSPTGWTPGSTATWVMSS